MKRRIKKVLLFSTPAFTFKNALDINPVPSLGLAYIGAVLEKIGVEVKVFDPLIDGWQHREEIKPGIIRVGSTFTEIEDQITDFNPDIVGVNNLFSKQRENARHIYALAKKINPDIITIAGGAHPTVMPDLVMEDKNVDFVVLGEGEETIQGLIEYIEGRKEHDRLDGVALRKDGNVKVIPKTRFIDDLDKIPFPAWHLLNMEKYFGLGESHGKRRHKYFSPIITSRGCPEGCTFCTAHHVWGRCYRKRSAENVIEEMRQLKNRYGIKELLFEDDNVTLDIHRAERIFDLMIEEKLGFEWDTPNGVAAFALNERLVKKMKDAGCYKLNIAVESGNPHVLKNIIKKPLDLHRIKPLLDYARSIGLEVGVFLIVGMPGESIDQIWDTFKFAKELKVYDAFVSVATPYPGSDLYKNCIEKGYITKDYSLDNLYISSFSISTENWKGEDLKKVFEQGCLYLKKYFYREHPFIFLKDVIVKLFRNPLGLLRKCYLALKIK